MVTTDDITTKSSTLLDTDKLLGTDDDDNSTKNFTLSDIKSYVLNYLRVYDYFITKSGSTYYIYDDNNSLVTSDTDFETVFSTLISSLSDDDIIQFDSNTEYLINNDTDYYIFTFSNLNNIIIRGAGYSSKIHLTPIRVSGVTGTGGMTFYFDTCENFIVEDLFFKGEQSDVYTVNEDYKTGRHLDLIHCSNMVFRNLYFEDGSYAVVDRDGTNNIYNNMNVANCEQFMSINPDCERITIDGVVHYKKTRTHDIGEGDVEDTGYCQTCIKVSGGSGHIINNVKGYGHYRELIRFMASDVDNVVVSNVYQNGIGDYGGEGSLSLYGLNFSAGSNLSITNVIMENVSAPLHFSPVYSNITQVNITNCNLTGGKYSIHFEDDSSGSYVTYEVNISNVKGVMGNITSTAPYGIFIDEGEVAGTTEVCNHITFENIKITPHPSSTNSTGMRLKSPATNMVWRNCWFEGSSGSDDISISYPFAYGIMENCHILRNDFNSGRSLTNKSYWSWRKFSGNTYGTDINSPTMYPNLTPNEPSIYTGTAAPSTTPYKVGDIYIDTTNDNTYMSKGTASSADWVQIN